MKIAHARRISAAVLTTVTIVSSTIPTFAWEERQPAQMAQGSKIDLAAIGKMPSAPAIPPGFTGDGSKLSKSRVGESLGSKSALMEKSKTAVGGFAMLSSMGIQSNKPFNMYIQNSLGKEGGMETLKTSDVEALGQAIENGAGQAPVKLTALSNINGKEQVVYGTLGIKDQRIVLSVTPATMNKVQALGRTHSLMRVEVSVNVISKSPKDQDVKNVFDPTTKKAKEEAFHNPELDVLVLTKYSSAVAPSRK